MTKSLPWDPIQFGLIFNLADLFLKSLIIKTRGNPFSKLPFSDPPLRIEVNGEAHSTVAVHVLTSFHWISFFFPKCFSLCIFVRVH